MYANGVLHTAQTHKTQQLLMFYSSCMTFHGYFCYDCVHMSLVYFSLLFVVIFLALTNNLTTIISHLDALSKRRDKRNI